jgi:hypothetical protein
MLNCRTAPANIAGQFVKGKMFRQVSLQPLRNFFEQIGAPDIDKFLHYDKVDQRKKQVNYVPGKHFIIVRQFEPGFFDIFFVNAGFLTPGNDSRRYAQFVSAGVSGSELPNLGVTDAVVVNFNWHDHFAETGMAKINQGAIHFFTAPSRGLVRIDTLR